MQVKLSTGRTVDTDKIVAVRNLGPYVEVQMRTADERVTDDINVSHEDAALIEEARAPKAQASAQQQ